MLLTEKMENTELTTITAMSESSADDSQREWFDREQIKQDLQDNLFLTSNAHIAENLPTFVHTTFYLYYNDETQRWTSIQTTGKTYFRCGVRVYGSELGELVENENWDKVFNLLYKKCLAAAKRSYKKLNTIQLQENNGIDKLQNLLERGIIPGNQQVTDICIHYLCNIKKAINEHNYGYYECDNIATLHNQYNVEIPVKVIMDALLAVLDEEGSNISIWTVDQLSTDLWSMIDHDRTEYQSAQGFIDRILKQSSVAKQLGELPPQGITRLVLLLTKTFPDDLDQITSYAAQLLADCDWTRIVNPDYPYIGKQEWAMTIERIITHPVKFIFDGSDSAETSQLHHLITVLMRIITQHVFLEEHDN